MSPEKVWVVGHSGVLGHEVTGVLDEAGLSYFGTGSEQDITDLEALRRFAATKRFDWIVNCAAYTDVDGAERDPDRAFAVNATGAHNLALVAAEHGAKLIHVSTDYVFSGKDGDYREDDVPAPLGVYGRSKLQGEQHVAALAAETKRLSAYFIVRTAWLYGRRGGSFVRTMLRLFSERDAVAVVDDQHGNPTYAHDVAQGLARIIERDTAASGIYHLTNRGRASRYALACAIYAGAKQRGLIDRTVTLRPITSSEYPTAAPRPADSTLAGARFAEAFGLQLPDWQDALNDYLDSLVQSTAAAADAAAATTPGGGIRA